MLTYQLHKKENIKIIENLILPVLQLLLFFAEAVEEYDNEEDTCA